jgi:hypothetical protein
LIALIGAGLVDTQGIYPSDSADIALAGATEGVPQILLTWNIDSVAGEARKAGNEELIITAPLMPAVR